MDYRTLGRSGLKVSPICLGTMMFGGPTDEVDFRAASSASAREAGVNFIDTADVYTDGRSEEITGRAIGATATPGCWPPRSPTRPGPGQRPRPVAAST